MVTSSLEIVPDGPAGPSDLANLTGHVHLVVLVGRQCLREILRLILLVP